ncbi:hypothetical protein [Xanthobacter sediminis]
MWLAAEDRGGCTVAGGKKGGLPAGTGEAELSQGGGTEDSFIHIGALARAVVDRISDRAKRAAPCVEPDEAPAGKSVAARAGRRRQIE